MLLPSRCGSYQPLMALQVNRIQHRWGSRAEPFEHATSQPLQYLMNNYRERKRYNSEVFLSDVLQALKLPSPFNRRHNGPGLWEVPQHQGTTPGDNTDGSSSAGGSGAGSGHPVTGSEFPARCKTEEFYSALCQQITGGASSHSEMRRKIQDAKISLQLKPRRFKSRLEIPQTSSREPMVTDEGRSVKSLTTLWEFAALSRPSQIQI